MLLYAHLPPDGFEGVAAADATTTTTTTTTTAAAITITATLSYYLSPTPSRIVLLPPPLPPPSHHLVELDLELSRFISVVIDLTLLDGIWLDNTIGLEDRLGVRARVGGSTRRWVETGIRSIGVGLGRVTWWAGTEETSTVSTAIILKG